MGDMSLLWYTPSERPVAAEHDVYGVAVIGRYRLSFV